MRRVKKGEDKELKADAGGVETIGLRGRRRRGMKSRNCDIREFEADKGRTTAVSGPSFRLVRMVDQKHREYMGSSDLCFDLYGGHFIYGQNRGEAKKGN